MAPSNKDRLALVCTIAQRLGKPSLHDHAITVLVTTTSTKLMQAAQRTQKIDETA